MAIDEASSMEVEQKVENDPSPLSAATAETDSTFAAEGISAIGVSRPSLMQNVSLAPEVGQSEMANPITELPPTLEIPAQESNNQRHQQKKDEPSSQTYSEAAADTPASFGIKVSFDRPFIGDTPGNEQ